MKNLKQYKSIKKTLISTKFQIDNSILRRVQKFFLCLLIVVLISPVLAEDQQNSAESDQEYDNSESIDSDTAEIIKITDTGKDHDTIGEINTIPGKECGWLQIKGVSDKVRIYNDLAYIGSGELTIKTTAGIHHISAKSENDTTDELVEIFKNDTAVITLSIDRNIRFAAALGCFWSLGRYRAFGPCHSLGFKCLDKHFFGVNFDCGFRSVEYSIMSGGGVTYTYSVNSKDFFILELGATTGFWQETYWNKKNSYEGEWDEESTALYFGGPKLRLQFGYRYIFLMNEITLLIGQGVKVLYNPYISFIF